ncbi:MAG: hypothetical protein LC637_05560 [Xanthomonadaceae bacterium]|nr:hypothetical protein [Xanthomonadaceae bacterium]
MTEESRQNVHTLHQSKPGAPFDVPVDQLERIIARASVLQHAAGDVDGRTLSEPEILAIGQEVRLDPEYVRQALAEYRADSLLPPAPAEHPLLARVLGPAHARIRRVMRGQPSEIHRDFERRLRSDERMRPVRLRASESVWEPDTSWTSKIHRLGLRAFVHRHFSAGAIHFRRCLALAAAGTGRARRNRDCLGLRSYQHEQQAPPRRTAAGGAAGPARNRTPLIQFRRRGLAPTGSHPVVAAR